MVAALLASRLNYVRISFNSVQAWLGDGIPVVPSRESLLGIETM
jgi:hypothetical protein